MKQSGHTYKFRSKVTEKVIKVYQSWVDAEQEDDKPIYRTKDDIIKQRKTKNDKLQWYKIRGYKASIMIPTTPRSILKNSIIRTYDSMKNSYERIAKIRASIIEYFETFLSVNLDIKIDS